MTPDLWAEKKQKSKERLVLRQNSCNFNRFQAAEKRLWQLRVLVFHGLLVEEASRFLLPGWWAQRVRSRENLGWRKLSHFDLWRASRILFCWAGLVLARFFSCVNGTIARALFADLARSRVLGSWMRMIGKLSVVSWWALLFVRRSYSRWGACILVTENRLATDGEVWSDACQPRCWRLFAKDFEKSSSSRCGKSLVLFTLRSRALLSFALASYLVDPASSHMLVSKIKPCMSKYKPH